jgi:hypothetical protein
MSYRWTIGLACGLVTANIALAADAEYAVRWDPFQGGPKTAAAIVPALGQGPAEEDRFEVRYASVGVGVSAPRE